MSQEDPNSFAQPNVYCCTALHVKLEARFDKKELQGLVKLTIVNKQSGIQNLILDTNKLSIASVAECKTGKKLDFVLAQPSAPFGSALTITLPESSSVSGVSTEIQIDYSTTPESSAVQWLAPEQTVGKKFPYLFTQCEAIHARSMIPCQDTPSVKAPYTAEITVPGDLTALMSAVSIGSETSPIDDKKKIYRFEQKVPIPSYLTALAIGALESRKIGPRSSVWSEKEIVDQAAYEFAETEQMLAIGEELCGPYVWGQYDLLVLPPSFPFGGMENPCLTFVTPTLLAGDRSLANVVAHEASHSWTGNLVTNKNWEHFWMNEGFTVFLERKIASRLADEKARHFAYIGGWKTLQESVNQFGADHPFTTLVPKLEGKDPDDAFSSVPYEKGSAFLFYLETIVGGPSKFEPFFKSYIENFKYKTVTTNQWRDYLLEYFKEEAQKGLFDKVDWDGWLYRPGMPPVKPHYDSTLADACTALSKKWLQAKESEWSSFSAADIKDFSAGQKIEFLSQLLLEDPLPLGKLQAMETAYNFNAARNSEIHFRWLRMCVKSGWEESFSLAVEFITSQGRMKFVRPLYRDLYAGSKSRQLALDTFLANRSMYHNIAAHQLEKDLALRA
eukprot:m.66744 g.66744  ORF g.66744 m.66744 type:complete len:616 (+) comp35408_c0_seq2:224-2071(+)